MTAGEGECRETEAGMSDNRNIEVLVVEDEALMRRNIIKKVGEAAPYVRVVGEAKNGKEALRLIQLLHPQIVLSDVYMPVMNGLDLAHALQTDYPDIRVVIISGHRDFEYAQHAIQYGVVNYLIKPLDFQSLKEVLESLRAEIIRERSDSFRRKMEQILSGNFTGGYQDRKYVFILAALGYSFYTPTVEVSTRLKSLWSQILGRFSLPEDSGWSVFNGGRSNEMYFLRESAEADTREAAEELFKKLSALTGNCQINLCGVLAPVPEKELFAVREQCSKELLERLMIGRSLLFWLDGQKEDSQRRETLLTIQQMNVINTLARCRSKAALSRELRKLMLEWDAMDCRQSTFENTISSILWMIAGNQPRCPEQKIWSAKSDILSQLIMAGNLSDIIPAVQSAVENLMRSDNIVTDRSEKNLAQMIEAYIQDHYTEQFSMEVLSSHFGFHLAYLARVFKNYKNESPLKYLIELRINRAVELMKQYPEMDIKNLGEAVGYDDQHYFSRVFKNVMGMSPLKYKESLEDSKR